MFDNFFNYRPMKDLAAYLETVNWASQAVAAKSAGSDPDLKTTGTAKCMINGTLVASLPAAATIDLSSTAVAPEIAGVKIPTTYEQYWLVVAKADGTCMVLKASAITLTSAGAVLKIPYFDATTYVAIGLIKYVNDSGSDYVPGTTSVDGTDCQITQILHSIVPHSDNIDKN